VDYLSGKLQEAHACMTIFQHAFSAGPENNDAVICLREVYDPIIVNKIKRHTSLSQLEMELDELLHDIFCHFFLYINRKGIAEFRFPGQLVVVWQKCAVSFIHELWRQQAKRNVNVVDIDTLSLPSVTPEFEKRLTAQELWERVATILTDEADRTLAYCLFVLDMKPAEIVEAYPSYWKTPNDVRVARQRILRQMSKDPILRAQFGAPKK
jgi:hypothetical protein